MNYDQFSLRDRRNRANITSHTRDINLLRRIATDDVDDAIRSTANSRLSQLISREDIK